MRYFEEVDQLYLLDELEKEAGDGRGNRHYNGKRPSNSYNNKGGYRKGSVPPNEQRNGFRSKQVQKVKQTNAIIDNNIGKKMEVVHSSPLFGEPNPVMRHAPIDKQVTQITTTGSSFRRTPVVSNTEALAFLKNKAKQSILSATEGVRTKVDSARGAIRENTNLIKEYAGMQKARASGAISSFKDRVTGKLKSLFTSTPKQEQKPIQKTPGTTVEITEKPITNAERRRQAKAELDGQKAENKKQRKARNKAKKALREADAAAKLEQQQAPKQQVQALRNPREAADSSRALRQGQERPMQAAPVSRAERVPTPAAPTQTAVSSAVTHVPGKGTQIMNPTGEQLRAARRAEASLLMVDRDTNKIKIIDSGRPSVSPMPPPSEAPKVPAIPQKSAPAAAGKMVAENIESVAPKAVRNLSPTVGNTAGKATRAIGMGTKVLGGLALTGAGAYAAKRVFGPQTMADKAMRFAKKNPLALAGGAIAGAIGAGSLLNKK